MKSSCLKLLLTTAMKWAWLYKQGAAHWLAGTVILKSCQFPQSCFDCMLRWAVKKRRQLSRLSRFLPQRLLKLAACLDSWSAPPMIIAHPNFSHSAAKVLPVNNATKRVGAVSGGNGARNPDCLTRRRLRATTLQTPTLGSPWWWNLVLLIKWSSIGTKYRKT